MKKPKQIFYKIEFEGLIRGFVDKAKEEYYTDEEIKKILAIVLSSLNVGT